MMSSVKQRTTARRPNAIPARRSRPRVESLETRNLLAIVVPPTITGSVLQNFTDAPLAGRVVYLDMHNDGRLDSDDPTATTDSTGTYTLTPPSIVNSAALTIRLQTFPGDVAVPATESVSVGKSGYVATGAFRLQQTSPVLPLSYTPTPFAGGTTDSATATVTALYNDILGRGPDPGGQATFVGQVRQGTPVSQLAASMLNSPEYMNRAVTSYYQNLLGRTPAAAEVAGWTSFLAANNSEEWVITQFFDSPEYTNRFAANSGFAQSLYNNVLGRQGTAAEVNQYVAALNAGATRPTLVQSFLTSPEAEARAVQGIYAVFLNRPADASSVPLRVNALQSGQLLATMTTEVASSPEATARAAAAVVITPRAPVSLPIANRIDYVFGLNGILYITDAGNVDRYDTQTGTMLTPFTVGGQLKGIDLSPDGSTLAVADGTRTGIDLVNTVTGASTAVNFTPAFYEGGAFDVAWGADGAVLVSTSFNGSGWVPLRRYDPATGTTTTVAGSIRQSSILGPSADRTTIGIAESNQTGGPIDIYNVAAGKLSLTMPNAGGWFLYDIASNSNGTQFVVPTYNGAYIYNFSGTALTQQTIIGTYASHGPIDAVYSPTSHYLFTGEYDYNGTLSGVKVYDTNTMTQVASLDTINISWQGNGAFTTGWLKIAPDGNTLAVSTAGGTRVYDVRAYSTGH